jgi:hypothetical protein
LLVGGLAVFACLEVLCADAVTAGHHAWLPSRGGCSLSVPYLCTWCCCLCAAIAAQPTLLFSTATSAVGVVCGVFGGSSCVDSVFVGALLWRGPLLVRSAVGGVCGCSTCVDIEVCGSLVVEGYCAHRAQRLAGC